jgi:hypothetical protein
MVQPAFTGQSALSSLSSQASPFPSPSLSTHQRTVVIGIEDAIAIVIVVAGVALPIAVGVELVRVLDEWAVVQTGHYARLPELDPANGDAKGPRIRNLIEPA